MKYLFITRTSWDEPPRARHQLAFALIKKKHEVVFVAKNKTGKPSINNIFHEGNLTVVTPNWYIKSIYNMRLPIINEIYQNWLYKLLLIQFQEYTVISFDPTASVLHKYFKRVIYFCNDNFLDKKRSKSFIFSIYWFFKQKTMIRKALFCTGVSKYLYNYLRQYNSNSYLLLTGASHGPANGSKTELPINGEKINIVFVGWLAKLNIDWVRSLSNNPNHTIYLIGPGENKKLDSLNNYKNIIITGKLVGPSLHALLNKANVCIAPYIIDIDTQEVYTMPNKFWLYISFGKPIVTCEINNIADLPEKFIYQSKNKEEFISNINRAVSEDSIDSYRNRMHFIKQNTWDNRADEFIHLCEEY